MKSIFLAISLLSCSALAIPSIGDFAKYEIKTDSEMAHYSQEIKSISNGLATIEMRIEQNGQSQTEVKDVDVNSLFTTSLLQTFVTHCVEVGGINETVTVKAGVIETCKKTVNNNAINIGVVPFGIVRSIAPNADGTTTTIELVEAR